MATNVRYNKPEAIKELERLYHDAKKLKYPKVPENGLVYSKFRDDKTNELTKCVIAYTRLKGFFIERINSSGRFINGKWIKGTGTNGTADLSAIVSGKSIKIEIKCKATKDRQSEAQKRYQKQIENAGAVYIIVGTFKEFFNWLNTFCHD